MLRDIHKLNKFLISCCDIVIYNKQFTFGLCPLSRHRTTKTLGISCLESDKGVFCYVNEVTFGKFLGPQGMEAGC